MNMCCFQEVWFGLWGSTSMRMSHESIVDRKEDEVAKKGDVVQQRASRERAVLYQISATQTVLNSSGQDYGIRRSDP